MGTLLRKATIGLWFKLFGPFVGAGLLGGFLIWLGVGNHWELTKAFGDALLIAGVIGAFVELFAASVLIDHAAKELSARLVGYGLPKRSQDLIHALVHETKRVYREYRKTYRIVRNAARDGHVTVHCTVTYRVVNNGRGRERYRPKLQEEGMYLPSVSSLQYGNHSFKGSELAQETQDGGVRSFDPSPYVSIRPSSATAAIESLSEDQVCIVRWAYQIEMPAYYSDVTAFAGMTINPTLELIEVPEDFEFIASEEPPCRHAGATWTYERAFVGGQHIRAWWRPRS